MIMRDDHLHTDYSDGTSTVEEMVEAAIAAGYKGITFTDHVRRDSDWTDRYIDHLRRMRDIYGKDIDIAIGVECKLTDHKGNLDCPETVLNDKDVIKVAAIHRIPDGEGGYISRTDIPADRQRAYDCYLKAASGIALNDLIDRFAHPFSLFNSFGITRDDERIWDEVGEVIRHIPVPIEYNVKYDNSIVPERIWNEFRDRTVYGSDSHCVEDLIQRSVLLKQQGES